MTTTTRFIPASARPLTACSSSERPATLHSGLSWAAERRRLPSPAASRIAVSIISSEDEVFDCAGGEVVRHLPGRMLAEIGRRCVDRAALTAVERELGAADHVDRNAGAVGGIFD